MKKRDKIHFRYKKPALETDKDDFKSTKIFPQKMLQEKKLLFKRKTSSKLKTKTKELLKSFLVQFLKKKRSQKFC